MRATAKEAYQVIGFEGRSRVYIGELAKAHPTLASTDGGLWLDIRNMGLRIL